MLKLGRVHLTRIWRLAVHCGAALFTVVAIAASMQAGVSGAEASVTGGQPVNNPFSPIYKHPYLRDAFPSVPQLHKMRLWARTHRMTAFNSTAPLTYHGGIDGIGVTSGHEQVYLVFYGSQWGTQGTNSNGYLTLSGDTSGEAPYLQQFIKGLGTDNETWSGVATQYCESVAAGAASCAASNPSHVAYPFGGALAGVWADESAASPAQATSHQLAQEAVNAAAHFGNTNPAANRDAQYVIVSPPGTNPEGLFPSYCGRHDYSTDPNLGGGPVTSPYGDLAFTNLPYVPSQGSGCGAGKVNNPGTLDGVSLVEGHEYAETITDQNLGGGWYGTNTDDENGDRCAWIPPGTPGGMANLTLATGTFPVQSTWANDANGGAGACEISHPIATSPYAPLIGVLTSGDALVKVGGLSTPWTNELTGVAQVVVATDPGHGPLIGVLTTSGDAYVKEGSLSAPWVKEYTGVQQIALASDRANGPLIGVLTTGGTALVKEGGLSTQWVTEYTGVSQLALASDPAHGPLIGVLTTGGTALVKEGGLHNAWVNELPGEHVSQIALASDPAHGPLIGVIYGLFRDALVKEGGLSTQWTHEYTGALQLALASDPANGPLIGVLTTGGTALVKEGGLSTQWVNEHTGVSQIALGSDPYYGPLISVLTTGGIDYTKQGKVPTFWTDEHNGVSQITDAG
jgi:serine protease